MENNKIIHLYITSYCEHNCKYCCNKQYEIDHIPTITVEELKNCDTVLLTGGEPFSIPYISKFIRTLRKQYPNIINLYVYTSGDLLLYWLSQGYNLKDALIDGVNISPKNNKDIEALITIFRSVYKHQILELSSNRIYLFPDVDTSRVQLLNLTPFTNTEVIERDWQEEFVPSSGIFRRLPILF